jgi:hypothetical protein
MPLTGLRVAVAEPGRAVLVVVVVVLEAETLGVLPSPPRTTLPLVVPRPLPAAAVPAARAFSSCSAFLAAASRRSWSSRSLRAAACCFAAVSLSISAMS